MTRLQPATHLIAALTLLAALVGACDAEPANLGPDADAVGPGDVADTSAPDTAPPRPHPALEGTVPGAFTVSPGVETVTVTGVAPGAEVTLYDAEGERLVTIIADGFGQAHFAYLPSSYMVLNLAETASPEVVTTGTVVFPGDDYVARLDEASPPEASAPFRVLDVRDAPAPEAFDGQPLDGVNFGLFGLAPGQQADDGFNYITTRDGVKLSAMVRLPDPFIWGDGPYPTVIEYSGYAPSNPARPDAGSRIATLLGFASVGVNMRGTGCSGGVFDVFSPAQHADGYDIVEVVARQPWALHGHVGMVGLSYPGISQLYAARTRPPSLAAITPMSVMADSWAQLWPGGIYNDGFTRQWLEERDREAAPGGQSWTDRRIEAGDTICAAHQQLRNQNIAFEKFFRFLEHYPAPASQRSLPLLVGEIEVPVLLAGAFQDEQTGGQFAEMLDAFDGASQASFILYNGRHVDAYSTLVITRWWEFLELYVARRVPRMPDFVRDLAGPEFAQEFDSTGLGFEPDRFAHLDEDDYAGALALYEAEPPVRLLLENGAGAEQPGAPEARLALELSSWPPTEARTASLFLADDGALAAEAPADARLAGYLHDPDAGNKTFFGPLGYQLMVRLWDIDWTEFPQGAALSWLTPPLEEDLLTAGPAHLELWLESDADDVHLQVSVSEVRPDGMEYLVQSGWHRVGHRGLDLANTTGARVAYTFAEEDFAPLEPGERIHTRVPLPSFAHPFRAGSQLRVMVATPGRNHGTWEFANPSYGDDVPQHRVAFGGDHPSALHLTVLDGVDLPAGLAPCPALRGQPCRPYLPRDNASVEAP